MPDRVERLVHYVISRCDPSRLGATKLAKILWYADLYFYRRHGQSITGLSNYVKMERGPVPVGFLAALDRLKAARKIHERGVPTAAGPRREFIWLEEPDLRDFGGEEIAMIDRIADIICAEHTAASISELSHDALWDEVPLGNSISLAAASAIPEEVTPDVMAWAEAVYDADRASA